MQAEGIQRWTDHPVRAGREFSSPVIRTIPIRLQCSALAFVESGHGKGAPDGIGGSKKRSADRHVTLGREIQMHKPFLMYFKANNP